MRVVVFLQAPPLQSPQFEREGPAASLARALGVPLINFGDLMRAHLSQGTELGTRAAKIIESGRAFPDEVITAIVRDHLAQETPASFLLDGHPYSHAQALALDALLHELGKPLDGAVRLSLPEEELAHRVRRLAGRRLCRNDHSHRVFVSSSDDVVAHLCNICGGELFQRQDDTESSIRGRISSHEATLEPIVQHYLVRDLLVGVEAVGAPEELTKRVLTALQELGRSR